jgi:hypothetical protein
MVHALRQARRVLKNGGYLLDLRPAIVHRRVGIEVDGSHKPVAVMDESFDGDYSANRAVKQMIEAGLLILRRRIRFDCRRRMDRFTDFKTWLEETARFGKIRSAEPLLEKVKAALKLRKGKKRIVVHAPVDLRVLIASPTKER